MPVSWDRIVSQHGERLFRTAYRVLHEATDAEDVTQDVMLEAFHMSQRDGRIPDIALLRRMTVLRSIDRLRLRRNSPSVDLDQLSGHGVSPEDSAERDECLYRLRSAVAQLPPLQSDCFALRYFEGMSNREIAELLSTEPTTVSTALHRARARLRESLEGLFT